MSCSAPTAGHFVTAWRRWTGWCWRNWPSMPSTTMRGGCARSPALVRWRSVSAVIPVRWPRRWPACVTLAWPSTTARPNRLAASVGRSIGLAPSPACGWPPTSPDQPWPGHTRPGHLRFHQGRSRHEWLLPERFHRERCHRTWRPTPSSRRLGARGGRLRARRRAGPQRRLVVASSDCSTRRGRLQRPQPPPSSARALIDGSLRQRPAPRPATRI